VNLEKNMSAITIKIENLDVVNAELSEIDDSLLQSLSGSGPISGLGAAFGTTLGIGLYGLATGQSTQSIWNQQVIFGGTAFVGGLLVPGP
jgi:hypothetical protein